MLKAVGWGGLLILLLFGSGGCATLESPPADTAGVEADAQRVDNGDPFESFNRSVYEFNVAFDDAIGKPVARAYVKAIPAPVRRSVSNFFNNLWEPNTSINALLQGKYRKAADSAGRFIMNSTVGVLGLFDAAGAFGLPRMEEDIGQTLAVWGVGDGPYLMLPFLGPSNLRDTAGIVTEYFTTDLVPLAFDEPERWWIGGARVIDARASVLGLDEALQFQVDPYLFLREGYRQSRLQQIRDGQIQAAPEEDLFEEELFND